MSPSDHYPGAYSGLVLNDYREVYPDHFWRYFELDGADLILTDAFQALPPSEKTDIFTLLNTFRDRRNTTRTMSGIGKYIERGVEGHVFSFGEGYVIKVMHDYEDLQEVDFPTRMLNMSMLSDYVHTYLPGWVEVVENYLYLNIGNISYTVMPRVGNGITLHDLHMYIKGFPLRQPEIMKNIRRDFPGFNQNDWDLLSEQLSRFEEWTDHLMISREYVVPSFHDFKTGNIIVTPLDEMIDGYPYKLWSIDQ